MPRRPATCLTHIPNPLAGFPWNNLEKLWVCPNSQWRLKAESRSGTLEETAKHKKKHITLRTWHLLHIILLSWLSLFSPASCLILLVNSIIALAQGALTTFTALTSSTTPAFWVTTYLFSGWMQLDQAQRNKLLFFFRTFPLEVDSRWIGLSIPRSSHA